MNHSTQKKFRRVELLLNEGDYKNALELVETISSGELQSTNDKITRFLLEGRLRTKIGELHKARLIIDETLSIDREQVNLLQIVDVFILKAEISWRLGNFDEGLHAVQEGEKLLVELGKEEEDEIKKRKKNLLHQGGIIHWYTGNLDQATVFNEQCLAISKEDNDKQGIANSLNNLGLIHQSKGKFKIALEYYQESLKIYEDLEDKENICKLYNNIGINYSYIGDQERALEYLQKNHEIRVELGNKVDIARSLLNIGAVYRMQGEISNALEYYQQGQRIYEEISNKKGIALALNNLGDVYQLKGDLNLALEYYQESLAIYEELGIKQDVAMSLTNIGELYRTKRNPDWALRYYKRSLAMYEELKNDPSIAKVLYELVWLALDGNEPALAQKHLEKLKQINERTDNRIVRHRYLIAKALLLKSHKRTRHKMKAEEILTEVVEEEVVNHKLTVTAMIHLCDLLLFELKMTGEEEILDEVKNLTKKLLNIAKQQSSHSLLIETYVLQSKLALLEMDVKKAQNLLEQALLNAEERGLRNLAIKIYSEKTLLEAQIEKWEYVIKHKAPLNERLELTRLEDVIARVTSERLEVTEEEVLQYTVRAKDLVKTFDELPKRKYKIRHLNLLKESSKTEKTSFRVAIAQIGLSKSGDILNEFYNEKINGLFILKKEQVETVRTKVKEMIENAHTHGVNILLFPELSIDLNYNQLLEEIKKLAKIYNMYIIPGSFHDQETRKNISVVIGANGALWRQEKHIPAIIRYQGRRFKEGIDIETSQRETIVCNTEYGTIAIAICRDFLDMDLRVELKNSEPPVDLIFNPAFTPVTEDFRAAHFDARRSVYAYCFFANIAEVGNSFIFTPERERNERKIPPKEESLIYKDVDLFRLRSERKRWEIEQSRQRPFIQSTRP
ncbi:MAG: tetratricopeptide repeat protein [Candidatus Hodarchaeales archaeon]